MSWKCIIEIKINIEYFMESGHLIICLIDYNFVVKTIRLIIILTSLILQ